MTTVPRRWRRASWKRSIESTSMRSATSSMASGESREGASSAQRLNLRAAREREDRDVGRAVEAIGHVNRADAAAHENRRVIAMPESGNDWKLARRDGAEERQVHLPAVCVPR